ncbi:MAG TPA: UDP-forming cellulose synthase catalytic subunit, partial [Acidobacteriaceae bacterium]|nr:UDP-forming cellulose synthase catalytic subunit [Acidobacteriaceae bacterium]
LWVNRASKSHLGTLTLLLLSIFSTFRYGFWRVKTAVAFFRDPFSHWTGWDAAFILLLLCAEFYAFMTMGLGYMQVLWPLRRSPVPLPEDPNDWPAVDILVPTFDEPLAVLRPTALAAMNIDWPAEKLNVHILDDGNREQVRAFAEEAGIGYIARNDRTHAKAGNINHALPQVSSPYVVVFDSDHVPTRSFLQLTMGWMLRDSKLAMLQTPHHAYSPDPFDRNLDQFRSVPTENELYYRVIQDGNDFWNATCFCGSCAVLRRSALDQVGGFAVETVTEDAHTSLRLQMHGWNTAYINIPQAAGLAPLRLSGYIRQRIRWARGMLHILRLENPLFAPELTGGQRLCYFHAMAHFLFALPRLIFLTAPLVYLLFGRVAMPGFWLAIVAYALPHLALSTIVSRRVQGEHRHAFWDHVYETVMAPFLLLPTLSTLFRSRPQEFSVTSKAGLVDREHFDARVAWPFLGLLGANLLGLLSAIPRLVRLPILRVPHWLAFVNWPATLYDPQHGGIVAVNLVWVLFNLVLLGVAIAVAQETRQRREFARLSVVLPSDIILPDGAMLQGVTSDLSNGGVRARTTGGIRVKPGDALKFVFPLLDGTATISAEAVRRDGDELRARFDTLSLQEQEALTTLLYSRADSWLNWRTDGQPGGAFASFWRLLRISVRTLTFRSPRRASSAGSTLSVLLLALLIAIPQMNAQTEGTAAEPAPSPARPAQSSESAATPSTTVHPRVPRSTAAAEPSSNFAQVLSLGDLGTFSGLMLRGTDSTQAVRFFVARDRLVKVADIKLRYRTAPGLIPAESHLILSLNGTVIATLPVSINPATPSDATVALPAELIRHENRLAFEFVGHYSTQCEDPANATVWAQIDPASSVELSGSRLIMTDDLASLPLPFYDVGGDKHPAIPIVFAAQPSMQEIQAAAIIASWFGTLAGPGALRFPVSIGTIPSGNAIVLAENSGQIPEALKDAAAPGAGIAIHANPSDPVSSVLLVTGSTADELLTAARALVLHKSTWQGPHVSIRNFVMPAPRKPDDASRWLRTDMTQTFGDLARLQPETAGSQQADTFTSDGSTPIRVPLTLPPDLDFADRENLPLRLDYRYNSVPLGQGSTLQVYLNGAYISSTPMPHADRASRVLETIVPVPVAGLRPFSNEFQFRFAFQRAPVANCAVPAPPLAGAVEPDSSLDITGISHSAVLPNLQLFANGGFPFTRLADLSETTVILPSIPTTTELETFLMLMSHFGAQSGNPAIRVTVAGPSGLGADRGRDTLVLGTPEDQPALQSLAGAMPVQLDATGLRIRPAASILNPRRWWLNRAPQDLGELATDGGAPDAVIEQFNWPARTDRSVVAIILHDAAAAQKFADVFSTAVEQVDINGTATVLRGTQFSAIAVAGNQYRVGENTLLERMTRALQQFPWIVAVVAALFCFLIAVLLQARLRRRARFRLQSSE